MNDQTGFDIQVAGLPGPRARTLLSAGRDPTAADGLDGDHFVNTFADRLYGPRNGGYWPLAVDWGAMLTSASASAVAAATSRDLAAIYRDEALTHAETAGAIEAAILTAIGGSTFSATLTAQAASRTIMAGFTGMTAGQQVLLTEAGRLGVFVWVAGDQSASVASDPFQGLFVPPASATSGASGVWSRRRVTDDLIAGWFGVPRDGSEIGPYSASMSAIISAQGGGDIHFFGGGVYGVGTQIDNGPMPAEYGGGTGRFAPATGYPFLFEGCDRPVAVDFHGAAVRCIAAAKFGSFEVDGTPTPAITTTTTKVGTPYFAMIRAKDCTAQVRLENAELDGNILNAVIGGEFGDTGRQIPMYAIRLDNCSGGVKVARVHGHHHGLDGLLINGVAASDSDPDENIEIVECNFECNGRSNCSITRGKGIRFRRTKLNWAGKAAPGSDTLGPVTSAPGAGCDIECETGIVRDVDFDEHCEAIGNSGVDLLCASGTDVARVTWRGGKLIGTTSWAAWLDVPGVTITGDALVVGPIVNPYASADVTLATKLIDCDISDDPALSPTSTVFSQGGSNTIIDAGGSGAENVLIQGGTIRLTDTARILPYGAGFKIRDVDWDQAGVIDAQLQGDFHGVNRIIGAWDASARVASIIFGETFHNDENVLVQSASHDFGTVVAGTPANYAFPTGGFWEGEDRRVAWLDPFPVGCTVQVARHTDGYVLVVVTNIGTSGPSVVVGPCTVYMKRSPLLAAF